MYYSSAASLKVTFICNSINAGFIRQTPPRIRGRKQIFVLSALFMCSFMIAVFLNVTPVYASARDLARSYHRQGYDAQLNDDYTKALAFYYKAAVIDSKNSSYWNDIGLAYEQLDEPASAEKAYLKALQIDPSFLAPYGNLGYLYYRKQNIVKAVYFLNKRIELGDPADPWTQKVREDLDHIYSTTPLYRERFMDAETKRLNLQASEQTRKNFQNQMRVASSEYERGLLLLKEQRTEEALKAFNASLAFAPQNPKAIQARNEAKRLHRAEQVSARVQKAMKLIEQGDEQAAKQQFNDVLAIIPNQPN